MKWQCPSVLLTEELHEQDEKAKDITLEDEPPVPDQKMSTMLLKMTLIWLFTPIWLLSPDFCLSSPLYLKILKSPKVGPHLLFYSIPVSFNM